MDPHRLSRRHLLKGGGAAVAGLSVLRIAGPAHAFPGYHDPASAGRGGRHDREPELGRPGDEVIPWLDQPAPNPIPENVGKLLVWEELETWRTPNAEFFFVAHFGVPANLDESTWRVEVGGLVARPLSLTLDDLKARPRREVDFTLECSGNNGTGLAFFIGGIGNARWGGTPLAAVLAEAGLRRGASEIVFYGIDRGPTTIRDNSGIVSAGATGTTTPDESGGLDLSITEQFARSMSVDEALDPRNLLCYEMNDAPLPPENGYPVRLIAPGWYGVANVKWLTRIEVIDHRYAGRFMARDYVTIREEPRNGDTVWTFTTVRHDRLKSAPAKVTRKDGRYHIWGAAWGAPIGAVEVRVDDGPWRPAMLLDSPGRRPSGVAWTFWGLPWEAPGPGDHRITSRAFDLHGRMQPAADDPYLASRRTYWENNGQITRTIRLA